MKCEKCNNDHDGKYGSGRFCSQKCSRGFSTSKSRDEINRKVSETLQISFHGKVVRDYTKKRFYEWLRESNNEKRKMYSFDPKHCLFCSKEIPYDERRKKYCNHKCAGKHKAGYDPISSKKLVVCRSKLCQNFILQLRRGSNSYCQLCLARSPKVKSVAARLGVARRNGDRELEQELTILLATLCNKTFKDMKSDSQRKRFLIKEYGHKCWSCFNTEWKGKPIPLELDHADGNRDDSSQSNLRILCPNCHAQTDTYKGKNVGRFPENIRGRKFYSAVKERKALEAKIQELTNQLKQVEQLNQSN